MEIRNGKRVTVTKRLYPGYVLVQHGAERADPARDQQHPGRDQVRRIGQVSAAAPGRRDQQDPRRRGRAEEKAQEEIPFHVGQVVEVTQGPFTDFSGTVQEVYPDKGKVKVEVSLFGRPTSVELDYTQLKGY